MNIRKRTVPILSVVCLLVLPFCLGAQTVRKHKDEAKLVGDARFLMESWQYKKAIAAYKKLIEESSDKSFIYAAGAEAHVRIGECFFHLHRYAEAAGWFRKALRDYARGSGRFMPRIKLGDTLVKLGQLDEARKTYRSASSVYQVDLDIEQRIRRLRNTSQPKNPPAKK